MKPKGQDTIDAIREWAKDELKNGPSQVYELGKFFFAVSTGMVSLFLGVEKLGPNPHLTNSLIAAVMFFLISIFLALSMVIPRVWNLRGETDLYEEYINQIKNASTIVWIWFAMWLLGMFFGIIAIMC